MKNLIRGLVAVSVLTLGIGTGMPAWAGAGHSTTHHGDEDVLSDSESEEEETHGMSSGGHGHSKWVNPPHEYAEKMNTSWTDMDQAKRGAIIYAEQCAACHGQSGTGDGEIAADLDHPPANLLNNFHIPEKGKGDAYMFWRVSEGGTVSPFLESGSLMPAFKDILSEKERWEVLAYVHNSFHTSGSADHASDEMMEKMDTDEHHDDEQSDDHADEQDDDHDDDKTS